MLHPANNDNSAPGPDTPAPLGLLRRASVRYLAKKDERLPLFTSILVWAVLAIIGWGIVAIIVRFI